MAQRVLAIMRSRIEVRSMATRSGRLRGRRRALGRWAVKAALTLRLSLFEAEELGVEGLGVRSPRAQDVEQAAAGLGDRGDPHRGSEEDRQEGSWP